MGSLSGRAAKPQLIGAIRPPVNGFAACLAERLGGRRRGGACPALWRSRVWQAIPLHPRQRPPLPGDIRAML